MARDRDANKPGVYLVPPSFPGMSPTVTFGGCPQTYEAMGLARLAKCAAAQPPCLSASPLRPAALARNCHPPLSSSASARFPSVVLSSGLQVSARCRGTIRSPRPLYSTALVPVGPHCLSDTRASGTTPPKPPSNRRAKGQIKAQIVLLSLPSRPLVPLSRIRGHRRASSGRTRSTSTPSGALRSSPRNTER